MIDPPGFALECFDPIGGYRDFFRSLGDGQRINLTVHGVKVRYKQGPPVDASGQLAGGQSFRDFIEFRDLLAADEPLLARAFVKKLLTFSTGREIGFSDRRPIEQIVQATAASNYGVRDLMLGVIRSDLFRRK